MAKLAPLILLALAGSQDPAAALLDRWRTGTEEQRLLALREAAVHHKDWSESVLAAFAQPPVPQKWTKPDELLDLVSREKIVSWYGLTLPLLSHADAGVRSRAAEELAKRELRRYAGLVVPLLRDPDLRVSWQAAFTLVEMEARERVPEIAPLLKNEGGPVR